MDLWLLWSELKQRRASRHSSLNSWTRLFGHLNTASLWLDFGWSFIWNSETANGWNLEAIKTIKDSILCCAICLQETHDLLQECTPHCETRSPYKMTSFNAVMRTFLIQRCRYRGVDTEAFGQYIGSRIWILFHCLLCLHDLSTRNSDAAFKPWCCKFTIALLLQQPTDAWMTEPI